MQPHGQFEMVRRGQMLICRPNGAFNLAGAMAYEADFREGFVELVGLPWGIVEVATEFEAAGPEVLARFRRQFGWCASSGCRFLAVVLEGGFKRYLADNLFRDLPFGAVRYFEQEAAAIHWLEQQLTPDPCDITVAGLTPS
ncbi:hypothetical protein [Aeromonas sobria]|uniref:hypothetical protein n=1 Tax=Aeromonas sobria TaxID=646 RepID=UPI0026EE32DD|nr:hypothetical protein [Aeromonas sobria]